jgi:predicted secreted acid phosphatase
MRFTRFLLLTGLIWGALSLGANQPPPLNLSKAKAAVRDYYESGRYDADVAQVSAWALEWVEERAAAAQPGERLALVLDIDETMLSNYAHMDSQDFGYVRDVWVDWIARAEGTAIEPMKAVYDRARELGIAIIFLTSRVDPEEKAGTIVNLERAGMGEYERLIFKMGEGIAPTAAERKLIRRAALEAEGWTIIASIGDQGSDLAGGHAERIFKLPNPFYGIP